MVRSGRNVELKARDPDPERSLLVCESLGAEARGILVQRDTYFHAGQGRLKLREEAGAMPHLIAYERPDLDGQRQSRYRIVPVEQADRLKAALADALGVMIEIAKERRLFMWNEVRIHLDRVEGLGDFIEFEALVGERESDLAEAEARVAALRQAFVLETTDLRGGSYSDLALGGGR
jgi:predicted adenylyl cyclase CyaB